jgi:hypothetical protein
MFLLANSAGSGRERSGSTFSTPPRPASVPLAYRSLLKEHDAHELFSKAPVRNLEGISSTTAFRPRAVLLHSAIARATTGVLAGLRRRYRDAAVTRKSIPSVVISGMLTKSSGRGVRTGEDYYRGAT